MARGARLLALLLATPLVLAGCSTENSGGGASESTAAAAAPADGDLEFAVVTHGSVGDRFLLLNRGRSPGDFAKGEVSREELTTMMVGGDELTELAEDLERRASA